MIKSVIAKFCVVHCTTQQFAAKFCKSQKAVLHSVAEPEPQGAGDVRSLIIWWEPEP
jgi:hypothetical protein